MSNNDKMVNSPIRWAGGKYRIRKKILEILPPHQCYIEVFGGAGWVLFGKQQSKVEILNDIDGEVMNFFRVVKQKPKELIRSFKWDLVSREEFETLRDMPPEQIAASTDVDRAHRFFYLIMASWGGEFGNPRFQTSISDGGHGNRLIGALKNINTRITEAHKRLQTVIIESRDWKECIDQYDGDYQTKQIVMYLDPPYPDNNVNYHHNMRSWDDHVLLAQKLRLMKSHFILSTYDLPRIRELYRGFHIYPIEFAAGMPKNNDEDTRHRNIEVIITNYDAKTYKRL